MADSNPPASVNVVKEGWLFKRGKQCNVIDVMKNSLNP